MKVTIDSGSGFCFGVTGAIRKAEEELQRGQLYCLGDIVHNGQEVDRLARLGLQTIGYDDLRQLHGVKVLLRAHGEPPSTYRTARENAIEIVDASCPVVKRLQERIRKTYIEQPEAQIVLFGKRGHAEVIGLQGQTENTAIVIETADELDQIDFHRPIALYSQTTKSVEEFGLLVQAIEARRREAGVDARCPFTWHDTICRNVAGRVDKLRQFARQNDVLVFVGGQKSSNARVLYEQCRQVNAFASFVSSEEELTEEWLGQQPIGEHTTIGICGATSTPLWLMEHCKQKIEILWNTRFRPSVY